jgi:hypothetical protein
MYLGELIQEHIYYDSDWTNGIDPALNDGRQISNA